MILHKPLQSLLSSCCKLSPGLIKLLLSSNRNPYSNDANRLQIRNISQIPSTYLKDYHKKDSQINFYDIKLIKNSLELSNVPTINIPVNNQKSFNEFQFPRQIFNHTGGFIPSFYSISLNQFNNKFLYSIMKPYKFKFRKQPINKWMKLIYIKNKLIHQIDNPKKLVEISRISQFKRLTIQDLEKIKIMLQKEKIKNCNLEGFLFNIADLILHLQISHRLQKKQKNLTKNQIAKFTIQSLQSYFQNKVSFKQEPIHQSQRLIGICTNSQITAATGRGAGAGKGGVLQYLRIQKKEAGIIYFTVEKTKRYNRMITQDKNKR